jgi:hypothetical protein
MFSLGVLTGAGQRGLDRGVASLQGAEGGLGADAQPGLVPLGAQQGAQRPGDRLTLAAGDHGLDRLPAVHAGVLQDHVPEQVLGAAPQVCPDGAVVQLGRCRLDVAEPGLADVRPVIADGHAGVDGPF